MKQMFYSLLVLGLFIGLYSCSEPRVDPVPEELNPENPDLVDPNDPNQQIPNPEIPNPDPNPEFPNPDPNPENPDPEFPDPNPDPVPGASSNSGGEVVLPESSSSSTVVIPPAGPDRLANITKACEITPPTVSGSKTGWGSRYWDCCKPHCSWRENVDSTATPFSICKNCNINDQEIPAFRLSPNADQWWQGYEGTKSGCDAGGEAYTCYDHAPYAVCEDLSYGYVAAPGSEAACGKCFLLEFDGGNKEGNIKNSHKMLKGKRMIVMASNIGHDVAAGQFDIMIPGGGLGAFAAGCKVQWGVDDNNEDLVGAKFGGLLTKCQQTHGWDDITSLKTCVRSKCDVLFGNKPEMKHLHDGCIWFVDWMHVADNPTYKYQEIDCPAELVGGYGSSRHPDKDSY